MGWKNKRETQPRKHVNTEKYVESERQSGATEPDCTDPNDYNCDGGVAGGGCGGGGAGGVSSLTGSLSSPAFSAGVCTGNGQVVIAW